MHFFANHDYQGYWPDNSDCRKVPVSSRFLEEVDKKRDVLRREIITQILQ